MTDPTEPYTGPIVTRATALAGGLPRYYTGNPCRRGHLAERTVSGWSCVVCMHERYLADYAANRGKYREQSSRWAAEHPDRMSQLQKAWAKANPENMKAARQKWRSDDANQEKERQYRQNTAPEAATRTALWRAANPERERENQRQWYAANQEKALARFRRWKSAHPDMVRLNVSNRRARLLQSEGSHTIGEILDLFAKQKGKCCHCHIRITLKKNKKNTLTEDHWIALSEGGSNRISNIKLSCKSCNSKKGRKDPLVFARTMGRLL